MNVYDFDGTIYDGDSTLDFFFYVLKRKPALVRYMVFQGTGFLLYVCRKIDKTAFKSMFFRFLRGIDAAALVEEFWDKHQNKIFSWYLCQKQQDDLVISASPEFLLAPICKRMGIPFLIASRVDIQTGTFLEKNCYGPAKVERLQQEFSDPQIDDFYSDSLSDLPLASLAKRAFLVEKGHVREWPM